MRKTKVAKEILSTERTFVSNVNLLINLFLNPLKEKAENGRQIIGKEKIKEIFSVIESIRETHTKMMKKIEERISKWNYWQMIGDIWTEMVSFSRLKRVHLFHFLFFYPTTLKGDSLKIASQYVNNYDNAIYVLNGEVSVNPTFAEFLEERRSLPECKKNDIKAFLVQPIQRNPRYEILLSEVLSNTDKGHLDFESIQDALVKVREINQFIEEERAASEETRKLVAVSNRLHPKFLGLVQPKRRFLLEGEMSASLRGRSLKNFHFFLFNDSWLLSSKTRTEFFKPKESFGFASFELFSYAPNSYFLVEKESNHVSLDKISFLDETKFLASLPVSVNKESLKDESLKDESKQVMKRSSARIGFKSFFLKEKIDSKESDSEGERDSPALSNKEKLSRISRGAEMNSDNKLANTYLSSLFEDTQKEKPRELKTRVSFSSENGSSPPVEKKLAGSPRKTFSGFFKKKNTANSNPSKKHSSLEIN